MMDPISYQRISELRQQEYLAIAEYERNAAPFRVSITETVTKLIARLTALTKTAAPAQTNTAPSMTEACVEC